MCKNMNKTEDEETLQEAFKILDRDNSGHITRNELKAVLNAFSKSGEDIEDRDIDAMIAEADVDGDGQISFQEVCNVAHIQPTHARAAWERSDQPSPLAAAASRARLRLTARAWCFAAVAVCKGHDEGWRLGRLVVRVRPIAELIARSPVVGGGCMSM